MNKELRYSESPSTEVSRTIPASPEVLWALLSDINLPARFSNEFKGAEWLDGASAPAVGARFRGTNEHPHIGNWTSESTLTVFEPQQHIEWQVEGGGGPAATWGFRLEATTDGTVVTQDCTLGPGRSGLNAAIENRPDKEHKIIAYRLAEHAENMERNLEGIASLI